MFSIIHGLKKMKGLKLAGIYKNTSDNSVVNFVHGIMIKMALFYFFPLKVTHFKANF